MRLSEPESLVVSLRDLRSRCSLRDSETDISEVISQKNWVNPVFLMSEPAEIYFEPLLAHFYSLMKMYQEYE